MSATRPASSFGGSARHKLGVLARHCDELGRPYGEIEKTLSTRLDPGEPADAFAERCAQLAGLGIEHVVVVTPGPWTEEGVATLAAAGSAVLPWALTRNERPERRVRAGIAGPLDVLVPERRNVERGAIARRESTFGRWAGKRRSRRARAPRLDVMHRMGA